MISIISEERGGAAAHCKEVQARKCSWVACLGLGLRSLLGVEDPPSEARVLSSFLRDACIL